LENVPIIQKMIVRKANTLGKPVIIATQMLRSMVDSPRPTRAEATDVANAVLDGADAVMLSEETASGQYPVEAVHFMAHIEASAEKQYPHNKYMQNPPHQNIAEAVAYSACVLSKQVEAKAIVATTRSGSTAIQISRFRPARPIIALSPDRMATRRLALYWGCSPFFLEHIENTDAMIEGAATTALEEGLAHKGDHLVITAGRPTWEIGTTNLLWVKTL
jgi:pyruvate kinase